MGQKVNPIGFRLPIRGNWQSQWFGKTNFKTNLEEDFKIRKIINEHFASQCITKIVIERFPKRVRITIHTPKPGAFIGKGSNNVETVTARLEKLIESENKMSIRLTEVRNYDSDAQYIAYSIAQQLSNRSATPYRRIMKRAMITAMMSGAQGVKISCSGRLAGAEIARTEQIKQGKIPLHTLRADIDFAFRTSLTTYGIIGVKVWICKGSGTVTQSSPRKFSRPQNFQSRNTGGRS